MNRIILPIPVLVCLTAMAQSVTPVATGLNSPRGVVFGPGGSLYVAEAGLAGGNGSGVGLTGSITAINGPGSSHPDSRRIVTGLASAGDEGEVVGPDGVSVLGNGEIYVIMAGSTTAMQAGNPGIDASIASQFGRLLKATPSGQSKVVADVGDFDFQWTADHQNAGFAPQGQFPDANPYAVLALAGRQYVADAGANTIDEVSSNGSVRILAFVPNPKLPAVQGGPPVITISDAVPTCVAQGPDGNLYLGTLAFGANFARFGANAPPFWKTLPPQSKVYRFDPNASSSIQFLSEANVWATGLNPITGCGFAPGGFYVTEFFTQQSGYTTGDVVRIAVNPDGTAGAHTAMGVGALHEANGFAAGPDGSIYVSNYSTSAGIGQVVRVNQ